MSAMRAGCDEPGCSATFLVAKEDDPTWALEWAGWQLKDGGAVTYCPDHRRWK